MQGFLFSRALPSCDIERLFLSKQKAIEMQRDRRRRM
jgi:EAL domain-containing protein (putative c-di-GMP-specific phosphodiesterase class I)